MPDTLATKQDLREIEVRIDARFSQIDTRLTEQERRLEVRLDEQAARFDGKLVDLERRITLRLGGITVASIGVVSVLVKLL